MGIGRLLGQERGQAVIIIALGMVSIVAVLGLILDAGYIFAQRRQVQNAADAAALAGARKLSGGPSSTTDQAVLEEIQLYATRNSPLGGVSVAALYIDSSNARIAPVGSYGSGTPPASSRGVEVIATTTFRTFLLGVIGISQGQAQASSIARTPTPVSGGSWAIWIGGTVQCSSGALSWSAANTIINGGVHSNSDLQVGGGGGVNIVNGSVETVNGVSGNLTYGGTGPNPLTGVVEPNPFRWNLADYRPGGAGALAAGSQYYYVVGNLTSYTVDGQGNTYLGAGRVLRSGLYYVTGDVDFQGGITATVTIVAEGKISIKGGDNRITLFQPTANPCALGGLVLFSNRTSSNLCADSGNVIELTGSSNIWQGFIYAPNGRVSISGSQTGTSSLTGAIVAQTVDMSGSHITINQSLLCPNIGLTGEYLVR